VTPRRVQAATVEQRAEAGVSSTRFSRDTAARIESRENRNTAVHPIRLRSGRLDSCPLLANATAATTIHIAQANADA